MKIGIYGGSFDPIHFGHLYLAIQIMEARKLDQIWFCPAQCNPFKINEQPIPINHRIQMLALVLPDVPNCHLLELEANRPGPSYTIDTLEELFQKEPSYEYSLIMGADAAMTFYQWKDAETIARKVPIFVGLRTIQQMSFDKKEWNPLVVDALKRGFTQTAYFDISSTLLRERLAQGKYCGHLIPEKALNYIATHQLYRERTKRTEAT